MLALLCCSAFATTPTPTSANQNVIGTVEPYTITITGPADISAWSLTRGINNEKDIGPVYISTTAPSTYQMKLEVTSSSDRLDSTPGVDGGALLTPMYISDVIPPVPDPSGWTQLTTGVFLTKTTPASTSPVGIPIRVRQFVSTDDADGSYSIMFTYTLSVIPPVTPTPTTT